MIARSVVVAAGRGVEAPSLGSVLVVTGSRAGGVLSLWDKVVARVGWVLGVGVGCVMPRGAVAR